MSRPLRPPRGSHAGKGSTGAGTPSTRDDTAGDERLGRFDVTVVDAWGVPVGGVDLELSYQGTRKSCEPRQTAGLVRQAGEGQDVLGRARALPNDHGPPLRAVDRRLP